MKIFETGEMTFVKGGRHQVLFQNFKGQLLHWNWRATETVKTVAGMNINIRGTYEQVRIRLVSAPIAIFQGKMLADF
jgi:hypothetical protein